MNNSKECDHHQSSGHVQNGVTNTDDESGTTLDASSVEDEVKVPSRMTKEQKILFITFGIVFLVNEVTFSIQAPFFPGEAEKQGATKTQVGLIFGVYSLIQFITAPVVGKFLPTIGCKFTFIAGFVVNSGCNVLYGFLDRVEPGTQFVVYAFVLRSVEAVGTISFMTALMAMVPNRFPDSVGRTMGNIEIFAGVGMTLGPFLGGLLYQLGGFMLPFVTLGGFSMILSLSLYFILPADNLSEEKTSGSYIQLMSIPGTWVGVVSIFIGSAALTFMEPSLSTELQQYKLTPTQVGLVFLLMGLGYAVTSPIAGWIADKRNNTRTLLAIGYIVAATSYFIAGPLPVLHLPNKLYILCIGVVLMYVALGFAITPTYQDMLTTVLHNGMPDLVSTHSVISGMFNSAFSLGSFFGPTMGARLVEQFSFAISSSIFGVLNLIAAAGIVLFSLWEFRCGKGRRKTMYFARYHVAADDTEPLLDNDDADDDADSIDHSKNTDEDEPPLSRFETQKNTIASDTNAILVV